MMHIDTNFGLTDMMQSALNAFSGDSGLFLFLLDYLVWIALSAFKGQKRSAVYLFHLFTLRKCGTQRPLTVHRLFGREVNGSGSAFKLLGVI